MKWLPLNLAGRAAIAIARIVPGFGIRLYLVATTKTEQQIVDDLNAFYSRRPRPWLSPHARARRQRVARRAASRSAR